MISGKLYTRDTIKNRPYYVIKYNEAVGSDEKTIPATEKWVAHNVSWEFLDNDTEKLLKSVKDIENLLIEHEALEIEFTINDNGTHDIGKIRELKDIADIPRPMSDKEFTDTKAYAKCSYLDFHHILSDGSYCDTERMLGNNPRPLEYSVYKELIDTGVWSENIRRLGYEGTAEEIIVRVGNKPYASMNNIIRSFFPKNLDQMLKYKLESYYEQEIEARKKSEKYFEQEIIIDSYGFDTEDKLKKLLEHGFTQEEVENIKAAFFNMTKNIVEEYETLSKEVEDDIEKLTKLRDDIISCDPCSETNSMKLFKYVEELINGFKQYGMGNLICVEQCVCISKGFYKALVKGDSNQRSVLYNVNRRLWAHEGKDDIFKIAVDVRGRAMKKNDNQYLSRLRRDKSVSISTDTLTTCIKEKGIDIDVKKLESFIATSLADAGKCIEEYIKSMELLSDIIIRIGEVMGIANEDMSYLEIQDLLGYHSRNSYIQILNSRRRIYHAYTYIVLPNIICNVGDIDIIYDV